MAESVIRTKTALPGVILISLEILVVYPAAEHCQMAAFGHHQMVVDVHYLKVVVLLRLEAVDDPYIAEVTQQCPPQQEPPPLHRCEG